MYSECTFTFQFSILKTKKKVELPEEKKGEELIFSSWGQ